VVVIQERVVNIEQEDDFLGWHFLAVANQVSGHHDYLAETAMTQDEWLATVSIFFHFRLTSVSHTRFVSYRRLNHPEYN
jgi:hypothetical protein